MRSVQLKQSAAVWELFCHYAVRQRDLRSLLLLTGVDPEPLGDYFRRMFGRVVDFAYYEYRAARHRCKRFKNDVSVNRRQNKECWIGVHFNEFSN